MKIKNLIVLIFLFIGTQSLFAQKFELLQDSTEIKDFNDYVNHILDYDRDTIIPRILPFEYQIVFATSCPYTEMYSFGSTGGKSMFANHNKNDDSSGVLSFVNQLNGNGLYICGDAPYKIYDSTLYSISLDSALNSTGFIISPSLSDGYGGLNSFRGWCYDKYTYVIFEKSFILGEGDQISYGVTETIFLERIE
jgi:hypothetical protein